MTSCHLITSAQLCFQIGWHCEVRDSVYHFGGETQLNPQIPRCWGKILKEQAEERHLCIYLLLKELSAEELLFLSLTPLPVKWDSVTPSIKATSRHQTMLHCHSRKNIPPSSSSNTEGSNLLLEGEQLKERNRRKTDPICLWLQA